MSRGARPLIRWLLPAAILLSLSGCGSEAEEVCEEGAVRCTGSSLEICSDGAFRTSQVCALGCEEGGDLAQCAQTGEVAYVGSESCLYCHATDPAALDWPTSGHAHAQTAVGRHAPDLPFTTVPSPPAGLTWEDVSYVVGGAAHRALFVGADGYLITGTAHNPGAEYLTGDGSFIPYETGETIPADCASCHGTGYDPDGQAPEGMPGLVGSWAEDGVGCEACHGPGGLHQSTALASDIVVEATSELCADCHARTGGEGVLAEDGLLLPKAQYDEVKASPHSGEIGCLDCHDAHASLHGEGGSHDGLVATCQSCHSDIQVNLRMAPEATCLDCHMPLLVKGATEAGPGQGDQRTHLVGISLDPAARLTNDAGDRATGSIPLDRACLRCHEDQDTTWAARTASLVHAPLPTEETFVGDETCAICHAEIHETYQASGHPHMLKATQGEAPSLPYTEIPPPPGLGWGEVSYLVGGYSHKANYLDSTGALLTSSEAQYNLATESFVPYHEGESLSYDCGACHTTGYDPEGDPPAGLSGIVGGFSQPGVTCEACHGAGGRHVLTTLPEDIIRDPSAQACGSCHTNLDPQDRIVEEDGFIRHEGQYQEWLASPHSQGDEPVACVSCHAPHESSTYGEDGAPPPGLVASCESCHPSEVENQKSYRMVLWNTCLDCHMPYATRSATGDASTWQADVRTHIVDIDPTSIGQFEDGFSKPALSLDFACKSCHRIGGEGLVYSDDELKAMATGYHTGPPTY